MDHKRIPPTPFHIERTHASYSQSQVNALFFSEDNERVFSGDGKGYVVCTSTRTFRPIAVWQAHKDTILSLCEWNENIATHGRDNKLHVWSPISALPVAVAESASSSAPKSTAPKHLYSLDVNSLNFCRFSFIPLPPSLQRESEGLEALVAIPNLAESEFSDIWSLPGLNRIHAAVGKEKGVSQTITTGERARSGIVMAHHLYHQDVEIKGKLCKQLRMVAAYEDGTVSLFARTDTFFSRSVEGQGWTKLWNVKVHVESVMAIAVSHDSSFILTVSADHLIGQILTSDELPEGTERMNIHRTKYPGNACVGLRHDDRICAVGGWDGKIRLYSTKTFKSLGTLSYHPETVYALSFAHPHSFTSHKGFDASVNESSDEDDAWTQYDLESRTQWLVSGGKEGRIAFWKLDSFERAKP